MVSFCPTRVPAKLIGVVLVVTVVGAAPPLFFVEPLPPFFGPFPVAFGDFSRAYVIADRVGLRITRDNVTNVGYVRFYIRKRTGGIVLNNNAVKWLKLL